MSYSQLLYAVPEELRKLIRKYENINKKLINLKWSIEFNSTCIKENILPNYSRIRHHDPAVATTATTMKYRRYLINREVDNKEKQKIELENCKNHCESQIKSFVCNTEAKDSVLSFLNPLAHEQLIQ